MSILNLIFLFLSIFGIEEQPSNHDFIFNMQEPCDIDLSVESTKLNDAYKVEVLVKNKTGNLEYFFFDKERHLLNVDADINKVQIKEKGEYFCIVVQNKKCHKKIDIKL